MAMMFSCLHHPKHPKVSSRTTIWFQRKGARQARKCSPEVLQELDLPQRPHAEHGVVERGDTFDGHLGSRRNVYGGSMIRTEPNGMRPAVIKSARIFG